MLSGSGVHQAFGAFITAFNQFLEEALHSPDIVERVKAGDYTLAMKALDGLTLCYVFKGYSFYAIDKLNKMTNMIQEHEDCSEFIRIAKHKPTIEQSSQLEECIATVFS